jgi:phage repressor protein C with HTH and peptisase S24 domain
MLSDRSGAAEGVDQSSRVQGLARIIGHSSELRFMRSVVNASCVTQDAKLWTMDTIAKRLKWARERKFGKDSTATDVARERGWTVSTYLGHENGDRNPSRETAKKYARTFGIRWEWLLENEGSPTPKPTVEKRAAGHVGAGEQVITFDEGSDGDPIELPPGAPPDLVPVIVRGNSMYPRYFEGEKLFYQPQPHDPDELIGRECVVKLADGRIMVKILRRGSRKRLYNLDSWNAPTIEDQKVEWATPVRWRG